MIVSRWETSDSGAIKYLWFVAVSAGVENTKGNFYSPQYRFKGFDCENGKKVEVDKETTAYYVRVSRDGTEIKIEY